MNKFLFYYLLFILLYTLHIENSVGNILFRVNSCNIKVLNITSYLNFLINPLFNKFLWNIKLLDLNFIFLTILFILLYFIFNNYNL